MSSRKAASLTVVSSAWLFIGVVFVSVVILRRLEGVNVVVDDLEAIYMTQACKQGIRNGVGQESSHLSR